MKALSQLITKWRAFEIFLKCSFEKIRQKPGNECKHRLLPRQSLTVLKFIEEKNNKWSEATNSAMRQRICACTRCLVFLFLSRFYTGQISKELPFCNDKTECFLLGSQTVNEWCGACTRCLFFESSRNSTSRTTSFSIPCHFIC